MIACPQTEPAERTGHISESGLSVYVGFSVQQDEALGGRGGGGVAVELRGVGATADAPLGKTGTLPLMT